MKILLIEDDEDTQANLRDILELDGHCVNSCASFVDAKTELGKGDVALMLLDRKLPDGRAEDLLPELKRIAPKIEIIVVTGYADLDSTIAAFRLGVADYLIKPINPDALRLSVNRIAMQHESAAALLTEQNFANEVLDIAEAIVLLLDLDGKIVRFNSYFQRTTGWKLQDLKGKDWFETCLPANETESVREVFFKVANDIDSAGVVNAIVTKDGSQRSIRWSNTTLKDKHGRTTSVLAIGIDITDLTSAQEHAMRAERLAAIGQMVTGLAHESRNALQRIQAAVEMLTLEIPAESDARSDVETISRASLDLQNLLEEVRSFAAPIYLHRERANLREIWHRVWGHLAITRNGRTVELKDDGIERFAIVDVMRMEQVFRNLFENSLAACQHDTKVLIDCESKNDSLITIKISDNGPGLNSQQREKIFEPFFTTKQRGTGLGMSIVQRIIDAHQGEISTDASFTAGARFIIQLPTHNK